MTIEHLGKDEGIPIDVELAQEIVKDQVEKTGLFTESLLLSNDNLLEEGYSTAHIISCLARGRRNVESLYVLAARLEETCPNYSVFIDESVPGRITFSVTKKEEKPSK